MSKKNQKVQVSARSPVQLAKGTWIYAEERADAMRMLKALDLCSFAWDMQMFLRDKLKHGHEYKTADEALEAVNERLYSELNDHGIDMNELYS